MHTAGRIILYTVGSRLIKCVGPSVNKTVHIWTKCNAVPQTGPSVNKTVHIWTKCNAVPQTGPSVNKTVHIWTKCNAVLQTQESICTLETVSLILAAVNLVIKYNWIISLLIWQ